MRESAVVLLENHGAITMGPSLTIALERMEVLENAAKMTFITHLMNSKKALTTEQIGWIDSM
jgi:L-fuculose-phosphate aldolase